MLFWGNSGFKCLFTAKSFYNTAVFAPKYLLLQKRILKLLHQEGKDGGGV